METVDKKIPKARHILKLGPSEMIKFIQSFDLILSDCDGVVWLLIEPIPKTGEGINLLKEAGKQYKFISNNSMRTDDEYMTKLTNIGVKDIKTSDFVHPLKTISRYLKREMPNQKVFSICSRTMNEEFIKNDIDLVTLEPCITLQNVDLPEAITPTEKVSAVIIDLNFNMTFHELARAQQCLLDDNCKLLVGACDKYVPIDKELVTIGSEGFVNLLRDCTGKEPIVLGKPGALLGHDLIERFNITNTKRTLFIGDSLFNDIRFAINTGFQTLFVLSGSGTMKEMMELSDAFKPDYIADSLADFIKFFEVIESNKFLYLRCKNP